MKRNSITIIGAGPAGSSAALYLAEQGYSCTLIEKDIFPREKTCGDALGGYVISVLDQISPLLLNGFMNRVPKIPINKAYFYSPSIKKIAFQTATSSKVNGPESFISKRIDFDSFLSEEVGKNDKIDFMESVKISSVHRESKTIVIKSSDGKHCYESDLVIFAHGAHHIAGNDLFSNPDSPGHSAFGIRAYFNNVKWFNDNDCIHMYFIKEILPGYLWIFPSTNGNANIGLAMDASRMKEKQINLQESFEMIVKKYPEIASRLDGSEQMSPWKGLKIPLGSRTVNMSGDNYLITGDAAWLASPLTGEGIGEAMYSGLFAAKQAIKAIENNNYSAAFLKEYDHSIHHKIGRLNKIYAIAQHMITSPLKANIAFGIMKNSFIKELVMNRINSVNKGSSKKNELFQ